MESLQPLFTTKNPHLVPMCVAGGVVLVTSCVAYKWLKRPRDAPSNDPPDTVILHQIGRGPRAPSLSPFPLKLETYLRMAKIPYQNKQDFTVSTKGKTPWISYNGEVVADSEFCIQYLNAKRGVDLNAHLTPEEKAVAKSFQIMFDEHAYWAVAYFRWVVHKAKVITDTFKTLPRFFLWSMRRKTVQATNAQGIGRHTREEVLSILVSDCQALSDFIGEKSFLMGERPCQEDCALFGQLCQLHYQQRDEDTGNLIQDKFPNLAKYCERMKERFWPDWEDCLYKG